MAGETDNTAYITGKPLICYNGEPFGIPEHTGEDACSVADAAQAVDHFFSIYQNICAPEEGMIEPELARERLQWIENPAGRSYQWRANDLPVFNSTRAIKQFCTQARMLSWPIIAHNYALPDLPHPFFDISYHLNVDQLQDFRSGQSFVEAAQTLAEHLTDKRSLNIVLPGSGSFMTPLFLAMQLIEKGTIDGGRFTFTEISSENGRAPAVEKVRIYLKALEGQFGLFSDLTESPRQEKDQGYEITFSWKYENKPMSLTMAIDRSESYSADEYLENADIVVMHSLGSSDAYHDLIERSANIWQRQGRQGWLMMEESSKRKYITSEEDEPMDGLDPIELGITVATETEFDPVDVDVPMQFYNIELPYGCAGAAVWHFTVGGSRMSEDEGIWKEEVLEGKPALVHQEKRRESDPWEGTTFHINSQFGATLIHVNAE